MVVKALAVVSGIAGNYREFFRQFAGYIMPVVLHAKDPMQDVNYIFSTPVYAVTQYAHGRQNKINCTECASNGVYLSMPDWVVVANFNNIHEASPAMAFLNGSGIRCELRDANVSSLMKYFDMVGSTVKLLVRDEDSGTALRILLDADIIKTSDLGPDPATVQLDRILNRPWIIKMLNNGQSLSIYLVGIFIILFLLILVVGYGGGKF